MLHDKGLKVLKNGVLLLAEFTEVECPLLLAEFAEVGCPFALSCRILQTRELGFFHAL